MVRVKICGITNVSDATAALDFGADALGFIFAESPRRVSAQIAAKISHAVGPWISLIGVFVNDSPQKIRQMVRDCGLSAVQLHGNESLEVLAQLDDVKVIKTFHVDENFSNARLKPYHSADAFLFDTKVGKKIGGTGKIFDWRILKAHSLRKPFIVSGGLHAGNVAGAVRFFKPYGVDVSSGVEKSAGKKDLKLMKEFIHNAKKV